VALFNARAQSQYETEGLVRIMNKWLQASDCCSKELHAAVKQLRLLEQQHNRHGIGMRCTAIAQDSIVAWYPAGCCDWAVLLRGQRRIAAQLRG
jgi:hypothetical protein